MKVVIIMFQQYPKASNLSCLLSANKNSELIPEPFRMQPKVIFKVTYSEYINYVLSLTSAMSVKLMTSTSVLSDMATVGHPKLYNYFLKDMAFAIIKELYYASICKKTASVILPASFNNNNVGLQRLLGVYANCSAAQAELMRKCEVVGYTLPKQLLGHNAQLFQIAVVLYSISMNDNAVEEMNLVYDIQ